MSEHGEREYPVGFPKRKAGYKWSRITVMLDFSKNWETYTRSHLQLGEKVG